MMGGMTGSVWRVRGDPLLPPTAAGPLDGLRVAVKDLIAVAGQPRGAGNPAWLAEQTPEAADAPAVAALRAAGAAIAGVVQTDELAFALSGTNVHYGTPPNPAAPDRVPGGSSSGPAAAVALGEADVGLGTDTAGSIRVPASCCGLFGLRPTHAAVPIDGVVPLATSYDTVGWLTRDAGTLLAVGRVLLPAGGPASTGLREPESRAGEERTAAPNRFLPARLVMPSQLLAAVADPVAQAVRSAAQRAATGWGIGLIERPVAWGDRLTELLAAFRTHQAAQAWRAHGAWIDAHPGALEPDIEGRFRYGATVDAGAEANARAALANWRVRLAHDVADAWLVLPAAGGPGHSRTPTAEVREAWRAATLRCAVPASAGGLPSVSMPAAGPGDPPVGMAVMGAAGADLALLHAVVLVVDRPAH
jgi:Asp-tRNA(Asn)/Glu-tRNA(Gln) amidotransferase A subunit family amidase